MEVLIIVIIDGVNILSSRNKCFLGFDMILNKLTVDVDRLNRKRITMRKLFVVLALFCLGVFSTFGEENTLYYEVQQAKKTNIYFENVVLEKTTASASALKNFENPNGVFFFKNISINVKQNKNQAINLILPLGAKKMVLELLDVSEFLHNYEVKTSNGKNFPANKDIKHYRGIVKDVGNSLVAITFYENEIVGFVSTDEGNFNIAKDNQSGKHFFYNEKNLKRRPNFECGTVDDISFSYDPNVLSKQRDIFSGNTSASQTRIINKEVRFYVETEYDMYQARGSVSSVEAYITGLFNHVAVLYLNEDILTSVSCIYVWVSNDPYTSANTDTLLNQFQNTRTSIIGDLGILLTFRTTINGGSGGMAASFSGLCNVSIAQKLSVAMLKSSDIIVPTYTWSLYVVTHELGHLFGSPHTHACYWNGNNTAIDGCAGHTELGSCSVPGIPPNGGTMMSYCHWQNVGIIFNLGFGTQPGALIRYRVTNAGCLLACNTPVNFTDQTVTEAVIVNSCGTINVQNTTVNSTGTLNLQAGNSVNINPPFTVNTGGTLTIQVP